MGVLQGDMAAVWQYAFLSPSFNSDFILASSDCSVVAKFSPRTGNAVLNNADSVRSIEKGYY